MPADLHVLRIFFRDEDIPEIRIPIPEYGDSGFRCLDADRPVRLPNGQQIAVYAEVSPDGAVPDISLSVIEDGRVFGVRCGHGVVVTYTTKDDFEVLLQIGTGAWEK